MSEVHRRIQVWEKLRGSLVSFLLKPGSDVVRASCWRIYPDESEYFRGRRLHKPFLGILLSCWAILIVTKFLLLSTLNFLFQLSICSEPPVVHHWENPDCIPNKFPVGLPWSSVFSCLNKPISLSLTSKSSTPTLMVLVHFPKITAADQCLVF